jgi:uncharacterized protein YceK
MRATRLIVAVVSALPVLAGCATSNALSGKDGSPVYGGTRLDAQIVAENLSPDPKAVRDNRLERPVMVWAAMCGLADMPLSAVADTVLLPVTVPVALSKPASTDGASERPEKSEQPASVNRSWVP